MSAKAEEENQNEELINKTIDDLLRHPNNIESQDEILKEYISPKKIFNLSSKSRSIAFLVVLATLFSLISNAVYIVSYLKKESNYSQFARGCDIIAFAIYFLEFLIKIVSELGYYFYSWINIFNLLLLISFIVPYCITDKMLELAYFGFFRVFQITTFFSHIPYFGTIEVVHRTILRNLVSTFIMLVLLIIAIFLFSIISYFCFTPDPNSPLQNLAQSIYFLTVEATGGGWTEFQSELDEVFSGARAFSILFIIFTYIVIVKGFAAFLADNSIVENRAYIKRKEAKQLQKEEAEKKIRPVQKVINISLEIEKNDSSGAEGTYITFSKILEQKIKLQFEDQSSKESINCKDFRNEVNKYDFWQFSSIQISIEQKSENVDPRVYFIQIIVSKNKIEKEDFKNDFNFSKLKSGFENFERRNIKSQKNQNAKADPNDPALNKEKEEMNKVKTILHYIFNDKKKGKQKENEQESDDVQYYDYYLFNYKDTVKVFPLIKIQSTDFQPTSKDYPYYVYIRYVKEIHYENKKLFHTINVPGELCTVTITLNLNLLGKKRASDIKENEIDGLNVISANDTKIKEDKMLMKSGFWVSSLITVLEDYSLHNRILNICYNKIFQRSIMMCDYMPITKELVKQNVDYKCDSDD